MRTQMMLFVMFLTAVGATPTLANYFHNPSTNLNLNIGSAPSPTPRDIQENRQPRVSQAAPSDDNVVAEDTTKNTDKPAANGHFPTQGGGGKNLSAADVLR